jgi:hypothetical protein
MMQIRQTNNNNYYYHYYLFSFTQQTRKDHGCIRQAAPTWDPLPPHQDQAINVVGDPLPHLDPAVAAAEDLHGHKKDHGCIRQAAPTWDPLPPRQDQAVDVVGDPLPHLDPAVAAAEDLHGHKSCGIVPAALVYALEVRCLHLFYTISTWLLIDLASTFLGVSFVA